MPKWPLFWKATGMYGRLLFDCKSAATFGVNILHQSPQFAQECVETQAPGELERYLRLAISREDIEQVLVLVDLDDGCAAQFHAEFSGRALPIS